MHRVRVNRVVLRQAGHHVSAELLREHVSEMRSDRLSGGQGGSPQRLHVLPRGLLQMCDLRHQAHPKDVLQQSAHNQRQGGVL